MYEGVSACIVMKECMSFERMPHNDVLGKKKKKKRKKERKKRRQAKGYASKCSPGEPGGIR